MKHKLIALLLCACIFSGATVFAAPVGSVNGYSWGSAPLQVNLPKAVVGYTDVELGRAITTYGTGAVQANRNHNMLLATQAIDYVIVYPGQVFSYNNTLGPRTAERGYKVATIFVESEKVPGLGGGICQISSTLYMATKRAGLQIVERYPHSIPVTYCSREDEATVAWGYLDYKFRNSLNVPIRIEAAMRNGVCNVAIWAMNPIYE